MRRSRVSPLFAALLALVLPLIGSTSATAEMLEQEAIDNATIQPAGPRSGTSGKNYFNVEGSANGTFASYGVADFSFGTLGTPAASINSATLKLTQSNAAFTTDGSVLVSLDISNTLADIQPGTSPLAFDAADPGTDTDVFEGDLNLVSMGDYSFIQVATGQLNEISLDISNVKTDLLSLLNAGKTIRVVIGSGSSNVAATWAGFSNNAYSGPTLALDYSPVPEPSTAVLMLIGLVAAPFAVKRWRSGK